jgi:hypothetical protein
MQNSTSNPSSNDIDDVSRAEAEVAARKAQLAQSLRQAEQSGQKLVKRLGSELKPAVIAGIAVAALATAAGITVALVRRSRSRHSRWLPPERPSPLAGAARAAGMLLLRVVARQVASQIVSRLDGAAGTPAPAQPRLAARPQTAI